MKIDWKRKLTSRKFWAAVAGFVSMLLIYFGKDAGNAEQVAALIMAGAAIVAYIIGEGIADSSGCAPYPDLPDSDAGNTGTETEFTYGIGGDTDAENLH